MELAKPWKRGQGTEDLNWKMEDARVAMLEGPSFESVEPRREQGFRSGARLFANE